MFAPCGRGGCSLRSWCQGVGGSFLLSPHDPITPSPCVPNGSKVVPDGSVVNDNFQMEANRWQHERFVEWLRGQLRRRGWNAAELGRRLQVPSGTISRWMTGERQPSSRSCDLLADVLGVDLDLVLTLAGHRPEAAVHQPDDQ